MEFVPVVAMGLLIIKLIDFFRYLAAYPRTRDLNGIVTQLVAWIAGVVVLLLVANTSWAPNIVIGGFALSKLGFWSLVFYGMATASGASLTNDLRKALDNHQSAAVPTLVGPGTPGPSAVADQP